MHVGNALTDRCLETEGKQIKAALEGDNTRANSVQPPEELRTPAHSMVTDVIMPQLGTESPQGCLKQLQREGSGCAVRTRQLFPE